MKKLIPIIMLLVGSGAGVGAGIFLRPSPPPTEAPASEPSEEATEETSSEESNVDVSNSEPDQGMEYIRLPNQFVVPLVEDDRISALVVMSLSIEIKLGNSETVIDKEPKLRDGFLRVLFDHASIGGFDGAFINNENLDIIRRKLVDVAKSVLGSDIANDVLIFEIARQDY